MNMWVDEMRLDAAFRLGQILSSICVDLTSPVVLMPILIKACSNTLRQFNVLNARLNNESGGHIAYDVGHNIGVTIRLPLGGVLVPVITDVQNRSLVNIVYKYQEMLSTYWDTGLFNADNVAEPTFIISNTGIIRPNCMRSLNPLLYVTNFAIGSLERRALSDSYGYREIHQMARGAVAADSRISGEVTLEAFIRTLKNLIENPYDLLL